MALRFLLRFDVVLFQAERGCGCVCECVFRHVSPSVKRGVYTRLLCLCESTAAPMIQIRESCKSIATAVTSAICPPGKESESFAPQTATDGVFGGLRWVKGVTANLIFSYYRFQIGQLSVSLQKIYNSPIICEAFCTPSELHNKSSPIRFMR